MVGFSGTQAQLAMASWSHLISAIQTKPNQTGKNWKKKISSIMSKKIKTSMRMNWLRVCHCAWWYWLVGWFVQRLGINIFLDSVHITFLILPPGVPTFSPWRSLNGWQVCYNQWQYDKYAAMNDTVTCVQDISKSVVFGGCCKVVVCVWSKVLHCTAQSFFCNSKFLP